jgi:hypothetical protein
MSATSSAQQPTPVSWQKTDVGPDSASNSAANAHDSASSSDKKAEVEADSIALSAAAQHALSNSAGSTYTDGSINNLSAMLDAAAAVIDNASTPYAQKVAAYSAVEHLKYLLVNSPSANGVDSNINMYSSRLDNIGLQFRTATANYTYQEMLQRDMSSSGGNEQNNSDNQNLAASTTTTLGSTASDSSNSSAQNAQSSDAAASVTSSAEHAAHSHKHQSDSQNG